MMQDTSTTDTGPSADGLSALEREAGRVDQMMNRGQGEAGHEEGKEGANGSNNSTQIEQDNRVEKAKADAKAAGGGSDKPEDGRIQDG